MRVYLYNDQELFSLQYYYERQDSPENTAHCSYSNLQSFKVYCSMGCTSFHDHIISTYLHVVLPPVSYKAPLLTFQFAHVITCSMHVHNPSFTCQTIIL